jgi:predicted DNA-binding transcriptional regulator AlpA
MPTGIRPHKQTGKQQTDEVMTVILSHAIPAPENVPIRAISIDPAALLDTKAAARLLSVSEIYLKIMRGRGEGPAFFRLGKRAIRYRHIDLEIWIGERFIETRRCAAANKPAFKTNTFTSRVNG